MFCSYKNSNLSPYCSSEADSVSSTEAHLVSFTQATGANTVTFICLGTTVLTISDLSVVQCIVKYCLSLSMVWTSLQVDLCKTILLYFHTVYYLTRCIQSLISGIWLLYASQLVQFNFIPLIIITDYL